MLVTMQVDGQFGPDGPQKGAVGICHEVRKIEDEYWCSVLFVKFDMMCMVLLDHLLVPNTENTMTYWSTFEQED